MVPDPDALVVYGSFFVVARFRVLIINEHTDTKHGIYIRWYLIKRCARKDQSLLFDLYKAFD